MLDAVDTLWEIEFKPQSTTLTTQAQTQMEDIHKKNAKIVLKIKDFLATHKCLIAFQLTEMADRLPPLNLHHMKDFVLDPWQRQVLANIDLCQSMIVCAPTSSGKTVLSSYVSVIGGKVLFVVPSEPLAWQVAALFHAMLKGQVMLVTPSNIYKPDNFRIVVGTPYALESALLDIGYDFEYAVFDEVHDLNGKEGDSLERLIKLVDCPFLALSATIGNAKVLQAWWASHHSHGEVKLMEYSGRFINLQRMIWQNGQLMHCHPCAAVTLEYLIQDGFAAGDLAFTPRDTYALWSEMEKAFDMSLISDLNPKVYFTVNFPTSRRITLLQSKDYEDAIKSRLGQLAVSHPSLTQGVLDSFAPNLVKVETDEKITLWPIVNVMCTESLVPAIAFQLNSTRCRQLFDTLLSDVEAAEDAKYPTYKSKLVKEMEEYNRVHKKAADKAAKGSNKSKTEEENAREAQEFDEVPPPDVHAPHPDFILTPMGYRLSSLEFREIKWQLRYELSENAEDGHALIRSLRRGIGIYCFGLPAAYLRVVQTLAQAGRLAIVLSDDSLAYGVNMPFRTCLFAEDSGADVLTSLMVQQMAGRAGRRGLDRQGNIVFAGMEWARIQTLMRGLLPDVVGKTDWRVPTVALQGYVSKFLTQDKLKKMTSFPLCHFVKGEDDPESNYLMQSHEWMTSLGLLSPSTAENEEYKLAVAQPLARMVWECRDMPSESMGMFFILEELYMAFNNKPGELIGLQMALFNIILRVIDRKKYVSSTPENTTNAVLTTPLTALAGQEEKWSSITKLIETYMKQVANMPLSMHLAVEDLDFDLDGYVMSTLVDNRVPEGLTTVQLNIIKRRLWHVGDRLRLMHNWLNDCPRYKLLEEILRKCFRRIKWILIDSEV